MVALGPQPFPEYGYVSTVYGSNPAEEPAKIWKFGPLLRYVSPCDPAGITLTGKSSHTDIHFVRPASGTGRGPTVRYTVTLANNNRRNKTVVATAFEPAGLVVTLPAGTTYAKKARVSPRPTTPGAKRSDKTLITPAYDAQANTVTWADVPLAGGRKRRYTVWAKVLSTATTPLVFKAACPNCVVLATESSVNVRMVYVSGGLGPYSQG